MTQLLILTFLTLPTALLAADSSDELTNHILKMSDSIEKKFESKVVEIARRNSVNYVKTENGIICSFADMEDKTKCVDTKKRSLELDLKKNGLVEKAD